jgi:hypothetical protein
MSLSVQKLVVATALSVTLLGTAFTSVAQGATKVSASTAQSEANALKYAQWDTNVTATIGKGSWTYKSSGLPSSNFEATYYAVPSNPQNVSASGASVIASATILKDQNYDYVLPLTPQYSKTTTTTNQGPIGIALNGAAFYNPYEANHATVATSDNFIATSNGETGSFIDDCDGHPGPGGQYHYHGLPACLVAYATGSTPSVASITSTDGATTSPVAETTAAAKKPVLVGFAFDGYGIYDNVSMTGATIPVSSLDACNGIFSAVPGYPKGVYHYVLENVKGARSSIGCYHGVVSSAYTQALQGVLNNGNTPPPAPNISSKIPETAKSLAASTSQDNLYRAMIASSGINRDC